jgi:hypothetical protein
LSSLSAHSVYFVQAVFIPYFFEIARLDIGETFSRQRSEAMQQIIVAVLIPASQVKDVQHVFSGPMS